ncbi:MAG: hypothetical protein QCI38_03435, partial [Candidatus Thermoplasmatota archaeon]|nr:hypothetical protein [Candidatus Thermoplasmatota archaeon]
TQWRRNRHGSSNNIEMDINGIPLDKHISAGYVTQPDVAIIIGADDFSVLKTIDWDENTFYVAPAGSSTVQFVFSHEYLQHGNTYLQTLYETSFDEAQEMQIRYVDFQDNQLFSGCQEAFEDKFLMYDSPFSVPTPIKNIEICFELSVPRAISQIWGLSEFASPFENNMMAKFFMALYSHVPGFLHIPTNAEVQYQFHHYNPEGQIEKYDYVLYNENQFLSNLCLKGRKQGFPILRYEKTISHFPDTEILNGGQYAYTPNEEHLQTTGGDTKAALRMEYTTYSDDSWVKIEYVGGKLDFGPYTIILKGTHILNVPPARNAPKLPLPFFSMDNLCWAAAQTMILNYWRNPGTSLQSGVTVEPSPFKDMPPLTTEITAVLQSYNHRFAFLKEYPGWFGYNSGNTAANQRHMFMYAESNAQSIGHEQFIKEFRNSINATPIGPAIGHPVYLWRYDGEFAGYGHALTGIGYSEVTVLKNGMPHSFQSYFYCENPGYYVGPSLIPGTDIGKIELEKPGFCAEPTTNHRWIYNVLYWGNNYPWV